MFFPGIIQQNKQFNFPDRFLIKKEEIHKKIKFLNCNISVSAVYSHDEGMFVVNITEQMGTAF